MLLRRVNVSDADVVLTLFTEQLGRVSASARSARASMRRFGGALEPMHTLRVALEERPSSELMMLREATLATPRHHLLESLEGLETAGRALRWLRQAAAPHTPEPAVWRITNELLDALNASPTER
ncbi:MAG: recombination protein O N-terminal domain-containing protein, partial [Polyangiaceae bacterium]|nr:recombination protein O N-terminal domain-containing protein [Polyangiaceae bacterium]